MVRDSMHSTSHRSRLFDVGDGYLRLEHLLPHVRKRRGPATREPLLMRVEQPGPRRRYTKCRTSIYEHSVAATRFVAGFVSCD
jgi:hypothetical protein